MEGQAILAVSAAVISLTQLVKWAGIQDKYGPIAVLAFSLLGVFFWGLTHQFVAPQAFDYFAGWIAAATSAAGTFGFTRAATSAVTAAKAPPMGGAGSEPTRKDPLNA